MRIYNTQTHQKEEFKPREAGKVRMYVCGPTVYNHVHIGNARTFISFDTIRRYLEWRGFEVEFAQNITDVDDKIIARAAEEGITAAQVAEKYTASFVDVMHRLNVKDPTIRPKATEEIDTMIALVQKLIDKGHAYEREGSVYFAVRSFGDYGKLSGRNVDEMQAGTRDQRGGDFAEDKDDPLDFALWKAAKPGEPAWESPWGKGRPGWHIECSAMSGKYLGLPLDIHGGGNDLVFPHHENETAQSEAAFGTTFCNLWMHSGMLLIDHEKMSKSEGNFLLAKDVADQYDVGVIRLLMLQTSYRSPLDYSKERLDEATASYGRITTALHNIQWALEHGAAAEEPDAEGQALMAAAQEAREQFVASMDDDFNTAGALGALFTLVSAANGASAAMQAGNGGLKAGLVAAKETLEELLEVLGVPVAAQEEQAGYPQEVVNLASELAGYTGAETAEAVALLLEARTAARAAKDWGRADAVRDGLAALGLKVEDTPAGPRVVVEA